MRPLSPKGAALCTAIAALLLSAPLFVAYRASHFWMILVLIALYFGGVIWTLYLQLKHPASALLMMRAFVIPSGVMSIFAALFVWALQGRLHELNLVSR